MKKKGRFLCKILLFLCFSILLNAEIEKSALSLKEIDEKIEQWFPRCKIPGMSVVVIRGDKEMLIKSLGYADLEKKIPVTGDTFFELGSCSKSFTALAALQLAERNIIDLDHPVSRYFPWFYATFKKQKYKITLQQLLHHTSGIPRDSISAIPRSDKRDALAQTVRNIVGIKLNNIPGKRFEYATINYDLVGAVIQEVSGMTFENYMRENIFEPLGLYNTTVGVKRNKPLMAAGYKISFFSPREYKSPIYRGNNPAGYIISNGKDISRWLKIHLGLVETGLTSLIRKSQIPDLSVQLNPIYLSFYAKGWMVSAKKGFRIFHSGSNPNFTAYIAFNLKDKIAAAVLSNSNSRNTNIIGNRIMSLLSGEKIDETIYAGGGLDSKFSMATFVLGIFLIILIVLLFSIAAGIFKGYRQLEPLNKSKFFKILLALLAGMPIILGVYFFPYAVAGVSWETALVWSPISLQALILMLFLNLATGFVIFCVTLLFPNKIEYSEKKKFIRLLPILLFMSFISGTAGAAAVFLISTSFFTTIPKGYLVYYFCLALFVSVSGRKVVQTKMIVVTNDIVFKLRMKLIRKIFLTTYQKFEKIDTGRILATLNNDTGMIANSANMVVGLTTSAVTALAAFVYLSSISFWATLSTLFVAFLLGVFYIIVAKKTRALFEIARDTQNVFMRLIDGMVKGYREISIHRNKKVEYEKDIENSCDEFRKKRCFAFIKFVNANLVSESMILILLASICIGLPLLFTDMPLAKLISFIMVLLYMIGPITGIMASLPGLIQIKVAWNRIQTFIKDIPAVVSKRGDDLKMLPPKKTVIESIKVEGMMFVYKSKNENENFKVGPINLEVNKGEILFLIGGNGSGKTTIANLLTGLFVTGGGSIKINGKEEQSDQLGEYFSVIFDNFHLFEKLYDINLSNREEEVQRLLKVLDLEGKVSLRDDSFSTIELSGGQRKRLALLLCYLEDRPIYLFDEVAADQDPEFRRFFYRNLLPQMKEKGKIVIAITHDDHYFDMADKIIKLDMGKIDSVENKYENRTKKIEGINI